MKQIYILFIFVITLSIPVFAQTDATPSKEALFTVPKDLMENVPADFPRFVFPGHDEEAQWLSRYYWYHFSNRPGNGKTLFNKEYLTQSDLWAAGAMDNRRGKTIQAVHREDILGMRMDEEGYVFTHQHFSHAHEHGWPFPLWPQVPQGYPGWTAGWHFQEDGPNWMWIWPMLKGMQNPKMNGLAATQNWELVNCQSLGIIDNKWQLKSTGLSPAIITPATPPSLLIDAYNSPFLQLRWTRSGEAPAHQLPYVEWQGEGETDFGEDRLVYFSMGQEDHEGTTGSKHCMIEMFRHPKWTGKIKRLRLSLAPGESDVTFNIDSFFTVYDTRHTINNPIFILSAWNYYRWTGDLDFLRTNLNRMREALRYQQTEMGGLQYNNIRNTWVGHDGRPAYDVDSEGKKTWHPGHGIGSNYWDLLPFGWDDFYATYQYYAATLVMADIEEAVRANPGWDLPLGAQAMEPQFLREHAVKVKENANRKFWNEKTGRFVACIDSNGNAHDYGFTFVNLDAIWYGIADDKHARAILDWLTGKRIIEGDTSTGEDIYHWRFGPRATTKRNIDWYGQGWTTPEGIPWGGQVQDGGAVLGFSFYDLWARLKVLGSDDAWNRLSEILAWEKEVWSEGGYREYYKDGKRGTTLQGGGTAGGIGIDHEFYESILIPSIVVYGFMGLEPGTDELAIRPSLPKDCPKMGISNLLYQGCRIDVVVSESQIELQLNDEASRTITIHLDAGWSSEQIQLRENHFNIKSKGRYLFSKR